LYHGGCKIDMSIKQRIDRLEADKGKELVTIRLYWQSDDPDYGIDPDTGELVELGPDVIRLKWPEDMGIIDD